MSNVLQVIENALIRAKADKCTRHIDQDGYTAGKSAFEYVNADLTANGFPALKKGELNKILGTKEMAAKGLTRFDANEPKPRTKAPSILDQLGLTPKDKIVRTKKGVDSAASPATSTEPTTTQNDGDDWGTTATATPAAPTITSETGTAVGDDLFE